MIKWCRSRLACRGEDGSAVIEFLFLSLVLMVPVVYLIITLGRVQEAAFAADAVARDVSRAAVVGGVESLHEGATAEQAERAARARADAALATTLADFHVDAADAVVDLSCSAQGCLTPGSDVTVGVSVSVALPGIGAWLPQARVTLESTGSSPVDGYLP